MSLETEREDINVLRLYKQFKGWANGEKLNTESIIILVPELISATEKIITENHKGYYKKQVVLKTLKLIVQDTNLPEDQKNILNTIIDTTIPMTIDTLISIAKGDLDIGKLKKTFCGCF